ncbi:ATP-grasp domain-containing protein [Methanosphaera sp.]
MNILVFEVSTIESTPHLYSEGYNMLKSILLDLEQVEEYSVDYIINSEIKINEIKKCNAIYIKKDFDSWLNDNIQNYDCCLFIAPEDNLIQYKYTKFFEENNITIIGSNSVASYTCTSKTRTYNEIPNTILKIPSIKLSKEEITYDEIKKIINTSNIIIKPDSNTSSNNIYHIHTNQELKNTINLIKKTNIEYFLIQEYIKGKSISVSALCDKDYVDIISINSQEIWENGKQITYNGCKTPITHPLEQDIIKTSEEIIKNISGLKGFVGIDFIIDEEKIYFVEINSRITTPYIVLQKLSNVNLTEALINLVLYSKKTHIYLEGKGKFYKKN